MMTTFVIKITALGLAKLAAVSAGGATVNLTQMAVGDGSGNPTTPDPMQTALVREVYRTMINSLRVDTNDLTIMHAEMLIPSNVGGFAIHEVGVFDQDGALFAVGNFPATWKPVAADGSTRDMIIDAAMKVHNASSITLVVDTQYVGATRQWVISTITRAYIIPGGTTHQVLRKINNADGNTEWADQTDANILVDVIKERQVAAAGQDTFTLNVCTTDGVAVYVEGSRQHEFQVLTGVSLKLSIALPLGAEVLFVQNEPNEPLKIPKRIKFIGYYIGQI
ncbi:phage tail protein [Massilia sp. DJPM01]|uniref:phage tail protein n=1 Tax=Massilia sp. DJPM01 TaxID=3024404 RepID=UPI00259E194E|nr:phage tail protein [Massilia sp. DJPM01]MDM5178520.1 phage tail protein [Massilia sp. DJPM01]